MVLNSKAWNEHVLGFGSVSAYLRTVRLEIYHANTFYQPIPNLLLHKIRCLCFQVSLSENKVPIKLVDDDAIKLGLSPCWDHFTYSNNQIQLVMYAMISPICWQTGIVMFNRWLWNLFFVDAPHGSKWWITGNIYIYIFNIIIKHSV